MLIRGAGTKGALPRLDKVACEEWSGGMLREPVCGGLV